MRSGRSPAGPGRGVGARSGSQHRRLGRRAVLAALVAGQDPARCGVLQPRCPGGAAVHPAHPGRGQQRGERCGHPARAADLHRGMPAGVEDLRGVRTVLRGQRGELTRQPRRGRGHPQVVAGRTVRIARPEVTCLGQAAEHVPELAVHRCRGTHRHSGDDATHQRHRQALDDDRAVAQFEMHLVGRAPQQPGGRPEHQLRCIVLAHRATLAHPGGRPGLSTEVAPSPSR